MAAQTSQELRLPRPAVLGIASGIFFMAFFGAFWGVASAVFMNGVFQIIAFILVALVTLGLLVMAFRLVRYARTLPKTLSQEEAREGKKISMWFGIVFGIESVLIAVARLGLRAMPQGV